MKIVEVNQENVKNLENFLTENKASLLQSFAWGEFQGRLDRRVWRLVVLEGDNAVASVLVIKYNLPLGKNYLYCSRGPVFVSDNQEAFKLILSRVKEIAREENSIFFRIDPEWDNTEENRKLLVDFGFKKSRKEVQPKNTLILDISKSEQEILAQMHSKTRYNIRLSSRKGVEVRISNGNERDFEAFWKLMEETTKRDRFKSHSKEYYKEQLEFFSQKNLIKLFLAEFKGKVVAAIMVSFYGSNAVYLHGASGYEHRKYMAPHLIQWEAIKEAKSRGCKYYDFWGIESSDQESKTKGKGQGQDWEGITRFKKGFAKEFGREKNYVGAWDLPVQKLWYGIYNIFSK